ncbi:hypothetical protein HU200_005697 [Digitaria exilis]|uniref:Uncharacterized protein n=1 Tax=Digitaria exilis TaxID=1010633 RepID=A0A835FQA4_9POAL|nr:hypothetical protein HU200_005697 [Digitaria exilis]
MGRPNPRSSRGPRKPGTESQRHPWRWLTNSFNRLLCLGGHPFLPRHPNPFVAFLNLFPLPWRAVCPPPHGNCPRRRGYINIRRAAAGAPAIVVVAPQSSATVVEASQFQELSSQSGKLSEIRMVLLESVTKAKDLGQLHPELPLGSSLVEMNWGVVTQLGAESVNGREKLVELRFMDIKIASLGHGVGRESIIRLLPELSFEKGARHTEKQLGTVNIGSFVESYLIASDAGDVSYRRDSDIGEEMIVSEDQNDENEWSWVNEGKDGDPLAESVSSLRTTQQVLESEIQKLSELGKELEAEESTSGNKDQDVIVLPYAEVDMLELNERMEHLEQKLEEASNTIREKDLRLSKLQTLISTSDRPTVGEEAASIDQLVAELEHHLLEKLEAEIQCLVMLKAKQNWQVRAEDRAALEEHRASAGDNSTGMLLKLRETESKIVMLKEQVDKLEVHEKELYRRTEVLKMQSRTFKVSLFGLLQLVMLCLSLRCSSPGARPVRRGCADVIRVPVACVGLRQSVNPFSVFTTS